MYSANSNLRKRFTSQLFSFCQRLDTDGQFRVFCLSLPSFLFLLLIALMILPIGLPGFMNLSYWWASPQNKVLVGQAHKQIWYLRGLISVAYLLLILAAVPFWIRFLQSRKSSAVLPLALSFATFMVVAVGLQYLQLGGLGSLAERATGPIWRIRPSYLEIARRIDNVPDFLRHVDAYMPVSQGPYNSKTPGFFLTFYGFDKFSTFLLRQLPISDIVDQRVLVAIEFFMVAGLSVVPLYFCARKIGSRQSALVSVMLFPFIPAIMHHLEKPGGWIYQLSILISATSFLCLIFGVEKRSWFYLMLCALVLVVGIYVNWVLFVLIPFYLLYATLAMTDTKPVSFWDNIIRALKALWPFVMGLVIFFLALLPLGFNVVEFLWKIITIMRTEDEVVRSATSMKLLFGFVGLYEFFVMLGIPISIQFAFRIGKRLSGDGDQGGLFKRRQAFLLDLLLIFMLALAFSGVSRAETSRLWSFLIPFTLILAVSELDDLKEPKNFVFVSVALYILQAVQVLVTQSVLLR